MTIDDLKNGEHGVKLIFETIAGSHAYGTNTPKSDTDIRGIFIHPPEAYLGLTTPAEQIQNDKQDIVYYSLYKFFNLAKDCNPNIIELLWMPEDCILYKSPEMEKLMSDNCRSLFISKRCFYTFSGYAHAQIKKAKGKNKRINNKKPADRPKKEDFCYLIQSMRREVKGTYYEFPSRPRPISEFNIDLKHYHAAQMERTNNIFRLYFYGQEAKGVFRGDDMVVCENIPVDDEEPRFAFLMLYSQAEYEAELREWTQYWDWYKNRNEERWIIQEKETNIERRYDGKNLSHCMRLLFSSEHILTQGTPIVRFGGDPLQYLRDIREGKLEYEEIMGEVERRMESLKTSYENSETIPNKVDIHAIEHLYRDLNQMAFPRSSP